MASQGTAKRAATKRMQNPKAQGPTSSRGVQRCVGIGGLEAPALAAMAGAAMQGAGLKLKVWALAKLHHLGAALMARVGASLSNFFWELCGRRDPVPREVEVDVSEEAIARMSAGSLAGGRCGAVFQALVVQKPMALLTPADGNQKPRTA
ncbi:unnamed protein product [Symbiodinium natans]|uniref:Uncharacterized protein n=1 Tax=Symbiodinium natans TaxID=878477 RepID=A0A812K7R8_9DINO|nr:unnamed protein product [Symbiodinium natans]